MGRKQVIDGGTRDDIIAAALELFFENGYEGTSVRAIMRKVNCEAGLFYYYFENKDVLYSIIIDKFIEQYAHKFDVLIEKRRRSPFCIMNEFFEYFKIVIDNFIENYADNMHRSMRWAVRDRAMNIIVPYIREILHILENAGAKLNINFDVTAMFISYGVGGIMMRSSSEPESLSNDVRLVINKLLGLDINNADLMFPYRPKEEELNSIRDLLIDNKEYLAMPDEKELSDLLLKHYVNNEIYVVYHKGKIVSAVIYSLLEKKIKAIVTDKKYRKKGIATRLIITVKAEFDIGECIGLEIDEEKCSKEGMDLFMKLGFHKEGTDDLICHITDIPR